jgi:hypothetical protein
VVEALVAAGHEVAAVDDLSSCEVADDAETGGTAPRWLPPGVRLLHPRAAATFPAESLVSCSLRHPVERERVLYGVGFDGLVAQTARLVFPFPKELRRVVVASTLGALARRGFPLGREPHDYLHRVLRDLLCYWHRPPHFSTYFVGLPELRGERRLPETLPPEGTPTAAVEAAAALLADAATGMRHKIDPDVLLLPDDGALPLGEPVGSGI